MSKFQKQLSLKIEQSGNVLYRRLTPRDKLTIGKNPDNDITLYGEHFPKKHILFSKKNNHFQIHLRKYMKGEVRVGESRLSFNDMIVHNLLPIKGENYCYPLTQDKEGYLIVGDAKIYFSFDGGTTKTFQEIEIRKFKGYSWLYATFKNMGRDLLFKGIVLMVIMFHAFTLNYLRELSKGFVPKVSITKVPERFARFIVKKTPESKIKENNLTRGFEKSTEEPAGPDANKTTRNNAEKSGEEEAIPESQGILGVLTGTGNTGQSSSMIDFLLDKGLVRELDQVISNSQLQVGKGTRRGNDLDELIALSESGGGIDDILNDLEEVETVSFGEKGHVEIERGGEIKGSPVALGKRSEESVRAVLVSYMGRLTYLYEKYLKREPELRGKMVVEVVISADGHVAEVKVVSSTLNNREFELDILDVIRRWKYDPINEGNVTVTYPLVFNKIE